MTKATQASLALPIFGSDDINIDELPDDVVPAENHPYNSEYHRDLRELRRTAMYVQMNLSVTQVDAIRQHFKGTPHSEIANSLNRKKEWVSRTLRLPNAKKLLSLYQLIQMTIDGVTPEHRKNFLWGIAQRHELKDARISISAVSEMNKMDHNKALVESGQAGNNTKVEIVINSAQLPRGPLDS